METPVIDEALVPLGSLVDLLSDLPTDGFRDEAAGVHLRPTSLTVEMPLELQILTNADGRVVLGSAPPLYAVATTLLPVFHNLRLTIAFDDPQQP
ncbi:hypothetical protein ACAW74_13885 [Fibrella sp. WM1]|uniref:hypothetical protein n=1 Tax=Fibrella musci TaxID=3242485 RepID=UPI0035225C13